MEKDKKQILKFISRAVFAGVLIGVAVFLFRVAATFIIHLSEDFFNFAQKGLWQGGVSFAAVILMGACAVFLMKKFPFSRGGGIPFALALSKLKIKLNGVGTFFATFFASLITFFTGIPLGTEGPSVFLGSVLGHELSKKEDFKEEITSASAGSGFCAATGSAIGGFLFSIEEMKGKIKAKQLIASLICVVFTYVTASVLCGVFGISFNLFEMQNLEKFPLALWWLPIVTGVLCGALAILFSLFSVKMRKVLTGFKKAKWLLAILTFAAAFFAGIFLKEASASGHHLIETLFKNNLVWYLLLAIIIARAVMLVLANSLGVTGGLFLPLLAIGALLGGVFLICTQGLNINLLNAQPYVVILFMAAFIGAVNKMPLTVTAFTCEIICGFGCILPVLIATLISSLLFNLICKKDLTDVIFEELNNEK